MPLVHLTDSLHNLAGLEHIPTGNLNSAQQFESEVIQFTTANINQVVPEIMNALNQAQALSKNWNLSVSKQLVSAAGQGAQALGSITSGLLKETNTLLGQVQKASGAAQSQPGQINQILGLIPNIDREIQAERVKLTSYGVLSAGAQGLGQSIGHFFTHGSFSNVAGPLNAQAALYRQDLQFRTESAHMAALLQNIGNIYNQVQALLNHLEFSLRDAQNATQHFLSEIPQVIAANAQQIVGQAVSSISNAISPIDNMINGATNT